MKPLPRTAISSLFLLLAFSGLGLLMAPAVMAEGSGDRASNGHGGHGHGGLYGGHHGSAARSHRGYGYGGIHHGLPSYGGRYYAGPYGGYRNYTHTGGYRSYGGFGYSTFPTYRFYPSYRSAAYAYPASYAPVADASYYATPGSVYDPVFQHGVAAQPLDDYPVSDSQPQPIYIIVQPAAAGSQQPLQTPEPVAQSRPVRPLAVAGGEEGQVFLSVHPANAAVYLDDELLGSGDVLTEGRAPLVLDSGVHVLEVVHPQHPTQRLVFGMPSSGRLRIEFDLEGDRRGRKARIKSLDEGRVQ